jgi:hypothetical protein
LKPSFFKAIINHYTVFFVKNLLLLAPKSTITNLIKIDI